jgi:hypothetical protein
MIENFELLQSLKSATRYFAYKGENMILGRERDDFRRTKKPQKQAIRF